MELERSAWRSSQDDVETALLRGANALPLNLERKWSEVAADQWHADALAPVFKSKLTVGKGFVRDINAVGASAVVDYILDDIVFSKDKASTRTQLLDVAGGVATLLARRFTFIEKLAAMTGVHVAARIWDQFAPEKEV